MKWSLKTEKAVCSEDVAEWLDLLIENYGTGGIHVLWRIIHVSVLTSEIQQR